MVNGLVLLALLATTPHSTLPEDLGGWVELGRLLPTLTSRLGRILAAVIIVVLNQQVLLQ